MSIQVLTSGAATTLQDQGRYGYQDQGVPVSGYMDANAANLANLLVNNPKGEVLIEMSLMGIKFKTTEAITIAITGADMQPTLNGIPIPMYKAIQIPKDGIVKLGGAKTGVYSYLAIAGGLKIPKEMGSKSTYMPAALGGLHGGMLQKGNEIELQNQQIVQNVSKVKSVIYPKEVDLMCLPGPEWNLFSEKSKTQFLNQTYKVTADSNRIGIRLQGATLKLPVVDEIISSGIVKGTIQVTKAGTPIVMMADAPTTGGYLRIANLTQQACNRLAQVVVGGSVRFVMK
ncbi:5-oxoprolinase subunit C family protein [Ochrovirga pacifica]|uniref:5-oxoprolinase subunit C family protein n=1 Tax=Ochrovirga pacifica TaxID=1042376 RepID=UPI0002559B40|nr:biotin-dependent carboxyltransferase family protein [Ochrovirga pacifica]